MTTPYQVATELLPAYSAGGLDVDQHRDVEALITDYIDEQLDAETKAAFDRVMADDAVLSQEVEKARRGKDILAELFPPATEPLEDPDSPEIQQFLKDVIANAEKAEEPEEDDVIPFPPTKPSPSRIWYALAASIVLTVLGGGTWFTLNLQRQLDEARLAQAGLEEEVDRLGDERSQQQEQIANLNAEIKTLTGDLDQAVTAGDDARKALATARTELATLNSDVGWLSDELEQTEAERRTATAAFTDAEIAIATLHDQQTSLEQQIAGLEADAQASQSEREANENERNALATDIERLQGDLVDAEIERDGAEDALGAAETRLGILQEDLSDVRTELASATAAERDAKARLAGVNQTLSTVRDERTALENRVADLSLRVEVGSTALEESRIRLANVEEALATVQTNWTDAQRQIVQQASDRAELDQKVAGLENRLKWVSQVAEYHAQFAQQPMRSWAEARANEPERLNLLLADLGTALGLGKPLPLPRTLADAGLTFVGARQLVINGMTVAQLAYRDGEGELFAFCIMRNPNDETRSLTASRYGSDLGLVDWSDQQHRYVVVGYEPIDDLQSVAKLLVERYEI